MKDCLRFLYERAAGPVRSCRKKVAAIGAAVYAGHIDLAGRLGRFRLAFRDLAHAFYLSPQSSKTAAAHSVTRL